MPVDILVKVLFREGHIKSEVMRFDSLDEAVKNCIGQGYEFDYVLEVERDEDVKIVRSRDVSEDFETRWMEIEQASVEDTFHHGLQDNDYTLDEYLERIEGPNFRQSSKREPALAIAAE